MAPRFAGPGAFRVPIVFIALAPLTVGSVLVDGLPHSSSVASIVFASVVSLAAAVLFFVGAGQIINRGLSHEGFSRTSFTVIVFGVTEAIRTSVFSSAMAMNGAGLEMLWPHRILGGSMTGMLVIGIVSLLSVDRDRYYADYSTLVLRHEQLARELEALNYTISRFIDDLTNNVREVVDTALRSLASTDSALSTRDVVGDIVNVSENVVRPLSQEVQAALPRESEGGQSLPKVSPRRVLYLATVVAPFQPVGMPLVIFMLFFSASLFLVPRETGLLLIALTVFGVWASHFIGARVLHQRLPRWPLRWRVVITTVVYSAGFFVSLGAILAYRGYGTTLDRMGTIVYVLFIVSLTSWGLALIPAIREGQREIIADMHATSASLMQVRARNEVRLRREKQWLSAIIHGDIQAILMATAMKVQKVSHSSDELVQVINDTRDAIISCFEREAGTTTAKTLDMVQQQLTDFWSGLVDVSWEISSEAVGAIQGDGDLTEMVFHVLREALTNAAKHGSASHAHIDLTVSDHLLVCRVSDNGVNRPDEERAGSGTQFFRAVADMVTLDYTKNGTVLTLHLPLPTALQNISIG